MSDNKLLATGSEARREEGDDGYPIVDDERRSIRAQPPVARKVTTIWPQPGPPHFHHGLLAATLCGFSISAVLCGLSGIVWPRFRPMRTERRSSPC